MFQSQFMLICLFMICYPADGFLFLHLMLLFWIFTTSHDALIQVHVKIIYGNLAKFAVECLNVRCEVYVCQGNWHHDRKLTCHKFSKLLIHHFLVQVYEDEVDFFSLFMKS